MKGERAVLCKRQGSSKCVLQCYYGKGIEPVHFIYLIIFSIFADPGTTYLYMTFSSYLRRDKQLKIFALGKQV